MAEPAPSFRDPMGRCCVTEHGVMRIVGKDSVEEFTGFLQTRAAKHFQDREELISSRRLVDSEVAGLRASGRLRAMLAAWPEAAVFEHERIRFASYPQEWPAEMLWAAGHLTLSLGRAVMADNFGLKDATPGNVLFRGPNPIFVDALSFEKRDPRDPVWKPAAQFARNFLLPLLVNKKWGTPLADVFTTHRDGLEPEEVYKLCGPLQRFEPRVLSLVSIPTWLSRKADPDDPSIYRPKLLANEEKARFIVDSLFSRMQGALDSLQPKAAKSVWSDYMAEHSYDDPAFAAKEKFVKEALAEFRPARVLDAGANTGHFSALAAKSGASVVAIDLDATCVGQIWRRAREQKLNILPLVVNLSRPTPAVGWRNQESLSFVDRATGSFDTVLMLALIHHLLVTERVPLAEILDLAAEMTTSILIVEYVAPQDAMFRRLTRGRDHLHLGLTEAAFAEAAQVRFDIVRSLPVPGTQRILYCLKKKGLA